MYYLVKVCRICLINDGELIKIQDEDVGNITFYKKMSLCFPNIIFEETNMKTFLCGNCSNILRKMYDFRELCINSDRILNTYISQLKQANVFKNNESCNLKELLDNNYEDLITSRKLMPQFSELKLEKFEPELEEVIIKTEILDVECDEDEWLKSNSLLDIDDEPVDVKPDCRDYVDNIERTDQNGTKVNNDFNIPSSNISEIGEIENKQIVEAKKRYKCHVCSKSYSCSSNLHVHIRIHTGEKPYECNVCNKSYSSSGQLRVHNRIHSGEKPYECNVCKKRFNQSSNLYLHKRLHTGEKPFECDVCRKGFKTAEQLRAHKRIHTGEKPFECEYCGKSFNHSCSLYKHTRIHTGEKPFECDVCKKTFSHSGNLQLHKIIHTGEKPYGCDVCGKKFNQPNSLQLHKRIHTGEKPYECDFCSKRFTQHGSLQRHKLIHIGETA